MKELKFTCPSCGQHIQCDWRHAGENIPCPGCARMLRVPEEGDLEDVAVPEPASAPTPAAKSSPQDNPFAPDTEKVSYASTRATDEPPPKQSPEPAPTPAASPAPPAKSSSAATANHTSELHCVCPVCQSELRISVEPEPVLAGAPPAAGPPLGERDRQIAAARERVLHTTSAKPHLDRILTATAEKK